MVAASLRSNNLEMLQKKATEGAATMLSSQEPAVQHEAVELLTDLRQYEGTDTLIVEALTDLVLLHDHNILAVLDKDKEMPEPSSKLFYSDPRATPDTETGSVSSFGSQMTSGSRLEQSLSAGLRMSRKFDHLVSLHHLERYREPGSMSHLRAQRRR